jgi:diguanylate cyclase (GGDEF)-like protein
MQRPGPCTAPWQRQRLRAIGGLVLAVLAGVTVAAEPDLAALQSLARTQPEEVARRLTEDLPGLPPEAPQGLEMMRLLATLQVRLGQPDQAERSVARIEQWARDTPDAGRRNEADTAVACLRAHLLQTSGGSLSRADALLEEALPRLAAGASATLRQYCLGVHADLKESQGHYEAAVRLYQDAIRLADQGRADWQRSELRSALANVLRRAGQLEQAQQVIQQALHLAREREDWLGQSKALTVTSILASATGRVDEELTTLQEALSLARKAGARFYEALCLANLSDYHLQHGEHAQALQLADQALPLARQTHNRSAESVALVNGGLALISMHRKEDGVRRVRESVDRDLRADDMVSATESLADLGRYLEQAGELSEAFAAYQEHRHLSDEVARRSQQRDIVDLQESFEADRRRHERKMLTEDNQIKEEQFRQHDLRYRFWFMMVGAATLLVLLAAWMYRRVRAAQAALHHRTERLRAESRQDALTGLANRRHFQALQAERGAGGGEARGALYLLDMDHFKQINDSRGHAAGDAVLVEVARRLRAVTREGDLVVRWGGEELLVLAEDTSDDQVDVLAQRLLNALAALPVTVGDQALPISASIGYAVFPLQPGQLELPWSLAVDLVDAAMYLAKTQGRNRACGVRRVMAERPDELAEMLNDLEAAWQQGRVHLTELCGPALPEGAP